MIAESSADTRRLAGRRGMALISAYMVLSLILIYSGGMTMRAGFQRVATERLQDRTQALQLAQGALDQLKENLYTYLSSYVSAQVHQNDAGKTLTWLDTLGAQGERQEDPPFDFPVADRNGDGRVSWAVVDGEMDTDGIRDGTPDNPRCVGGLPTVSSTACAKVGEAVAQPRAWIVSVKKTKPDVLAPRLMTLEAEAKVGSVTKRIQAQYEIAMGMSDIFKYGYFVNNYGWFTAPAGSTITVNGEVRANGDLTFYGNVNQVAVNGDLFASENPSLINPVTGEPATGMITGDPAGATSWSGYWWVKAWGVSGKQARPARRLVDKSQPPIGGSEKLLPLGSGWDDTNLVTKTMGAGKWEVKTTGVEQRRFENQPTHDIPYLGDLGFYEQLAKSKDSSVTYNTAGADGYYGTADDGRKTLRHAYAGLDGTVGTADDDLPLILVGTSARPIVLDGPVVVPGDVIIKGVVTGRGTIYAGRNLHIAGAITYQTPPEWRLLEREGVTGTLREKETRANLGVVCSDGRYVKPGASVPADCVTPPKKEDSEIVF